MNYQCVISFILNSIPEKPEAKIYRVGTDIYKDINK